MQKTTKLLSTLIALVLVSSIAITYINPVSADDTYTTYPFCGVIPDHTGIGQQVTLHIGITTPTAYPQTGWTGLTVTVTKPDNTTEQLGPFNTDTTGGTGVSYVPAMAGTYYFQTHFPQQLQTYIGIFGYTPVNNTMKASDSEKTPLYVTEEPVQYYQDNQPLPTNYWTSPIDSQLRGWSSVSGNWLSVSLIPNRIALSNDAPQSAHILWSMNDLGGSGAGLVGGDQYDSHGYYTGDAYEGKFAGSVIIDGVLYFNQNLNSMQGTGAIDQSVVAVDLHTGQTLWTKNLNNTRLAFGQILYWDSPNGHGAYSYLWTTSGTTWNAYDPLTGNWVYGMTNVPGGTNYLGPNGEIIKFSISNGRLLRWNSTWAMKYYDKTNPELYAPYSWLAGHSALIGTTKDASLGYDLNVSIASLPGSIRAVLLKDMTNTGTGGQDIISSNDRIIGANIGAKQTTVWGVSLVPGKEGTLLFNTTWNNPSDWISGNQTISWVASSPQDLVGILWSKEMRQHYGVSLTTGQLIWGPTLSQSYLDQYEGTQLTSHYIAYGNLYTVGVGGTLYCWNVTTGVLQWNVNVTDTYHEYKVGNNWWMGIPFISNGIIYMGYCEHSSGDPKPRGGPFMAVNATDGSVIWSIDGAFRQTTWGGAAIIGDSIIATMDTYNQQIYAIGKGPSDTTVTAQQFGSSIVMSGIVTDVSPGTSQDALKLRFPNGVPAVSDASMSDWMLYVYKQFSLPTTSTGVDVTLSVLDANNNFREIGKTTSDASGYYSLNWKPDIPGKYTVYASFAGTNGYWPSSAETSFAVDEAASTPVPTTTAASNFATTTDLMMYIVGAAVAIIIVIAIGFALVLRKRP